MFTTIHGLKYHLLFIVLYHCLSFIWESGKRSSCTYQEEAAIVNDRPIIGILTKKSNLPQHIKHGDEYVDGIFVQYLEMAGAKVVPIRPGRHRKYYEKLFSHINGVFLPGGSDNLFNSTYLKSGEIMFELAMEANKRGDYFPIWGTCRGFELMLHLVVPNASDAFTETFSQNITLPLEFIDDSKNSRLYRGTPQHLIDYMSAENAAMHNNKWSILLQDFEEDLHLKQFFRVITTSHHKDYEFVSTIEARDYPFYGVQWHPERNIFWTHNLTVNRNYIAMKVAYHLALFFITESRKNSHHFESIEDENFAVIQNAKRVYVPSFQYGEKFYFNHSDDRVY